MIKVYDEFTQLKEVILGNINKELVKYVPKDEQSLILDIFDQTIEDLDEIQKYIKIMVSLSIDQNYHPTIQTLFLHQIQPLKV